MKYKLYQNYPDPFNPSTTVRFDLKEKSKVTLEIFNILGQRVTYWNYGEMNAGQYDKVINMSAYASGLYIYRLTAGSYNQTKKMLLLK